jgi:hypothetical protein
MPRPAHLVSLCNVLGALALAACAADPAPEQTGRGEEALIDDIASMSARADGTFDVVCKDGRRERVTAAQLRNDEVCSRGGSAGACVEGTWSACNDATEHWTGSLCCVDNRPACVEGTWSACNDAKEHWTGAKCCVENRPTCVEGTWSACNDAKEHWTGTECCVEDVRECVEGTWSSCTDANEHWTGTKCCVE